MLKIARRTISSISAQMDDNGKEDFDRASDAELSPEAIEDRERKDLENQIIEQWAKVWFGLYQVNDKQGPYHINQIRRLYYGAGMAGYLMKQSLDKKHAPQPLGLLGIVLSTSGSNYGGDSPAGGIQDLKLFDNLSLPTLKSTLDLLAAYEKEIEPLQEIYSLLRSLQVDLSLTPTADEVEKVLTRYPPLADPIAERIVHYNSRLAVLCMDVETEAMDRYKEMRMKLPVDEFGASSESKPPVGWYVSQRVFPRGRKTGIFSSSVR